MYTREDSTAPASPFYSNFQDFTKVKTKKEALQRDQSSPGRPKDAVSSHSALRHPREGQSPASQPISAGERNPTREAELPRRKVKRRWNSHFAFPCFPLALWLSPSAPGG